MKYEFTKRWKASRYVLPGYILLQSALLLISGVFFWNGNMAKAFAENGFGCPAIGVPSAIAIILYFVMALLICVYPYAEGITRFNLDLSGRQSVLEHMIPAASREKIISKLISVLCSTVVCFVLGALSVVSFFLLAGGLQSPIADVILKVIQDVIQSPARLVVGLLYILFNILSM